MSRNRPARRLKPRLFERDGWEHGDGSWRALCAFGCGTVLDMGSAAVDRWPVPGRDGGEYVLSNTRLACRPCNCAERCVPVADRKPVAVSKSYRFLHAINPDKL